MRKPSYRVPQNEHGQAMILAVICLLVLCLGLFLVFDTGQVVSKKVQLTNAADAAAYSVAIEQARALNTAAYLNRAEVANQVAIAQIVSLQSYGIYLDSSAGRWSRYLSYLEWIPYVGEVAAAVSDALKAAQEAIVPVLTGSHGVEVIAVNALNVLNEAYSQVQARVFQAFAMESGFATAKDVVAANTPGVDDGVSDATIPAAGKSLLYAQLYQFAEFGPDTHIASGNRGYTTRYKIPRAPNGLSGVRRDWAGDRVANVAMQARDNLSSHRNKSLGPFKKKGSTDLVDYNRWVAVDTSKFDLDLWLFSIKFTTGMGAAAAFPTDATPNSRPIISPGVRLTKGTGDGPSDYRAGHGWGWDSPYDRHHDDAYNGALSNVGDVANNPTDRNYTRMVPQEVSWMRSKDSGLRDYNDVEPGKAVAPYEISSKDKTDVGPIFTVFVQQTDDKVRTGSVIGMTGGGLRLKNKGAGNAVSAVSSAQVYYDRPWWNLGFIARRAGSSNDNRNRELGNLFEPYWQVRLVETPTAYKAALGVTSAI